MVGTVALGPFNSTMELRQSQVRDRPSTQGRTSNSRSTCPPQKPPTTLQQAQSVRDALTGRSNDLDLLITQYQRKATHSPKELDRLAGLARCLMDPLPDLQRVVGTLREQARVRSDYRSVAELNKVDNDLFNLALKEGRRILQLEGLKEDARREMLCKNLPQPRTVDMAENAPVALRGDIDHVKTSIDRYLANPTRQQQKSALDSMACMRNVIKDLQATLDIFDRKARAAGDARTRSKISELRGVFAGLLRDIQVQDDRMRFGRPVR